MEKIRTAVVGAGSIAQVVHIPILKNMEDIELTAICDDDQAKLTKLIDKFEIPHGYSMIDNLIRNEKPDALHICTTSHYHYPMAYLALKNNVNVFVEKPIALNAADAAKLVELAEEKKLLLMVGMQNRFRDDVEILKEFMDNGELGELFYIKAGWLKKWSKETVPSWQTSRQAAGGGVMIVMGTQLIDLALFLIGMPDIKSVQLFDYTLDKHEVEDAALAVIETKKGLTITIEVSWKMHLENDMIYTHIFGKNGAAYLNPLRVNKELHGNLVNVTPLTGEKTSAQRFKDAYRNEIHHFYNLVRTGEENISSAADALQVMKIMDALYESSRKNEKVRLD